MPDQFSSPTLDTSVVLLPSGHFLVRRIPLVAEGDARAQVELALEAHSPFPPAQLYYGHALEPGAPEALIYATHRRNFPPEATAAWGSAAAVLPGFAPWLAVGEAPPAAGLGWRHQADALEVVAWDGRHHLPQVVLTRTLAPEEESGAVRSALIAEVRRRAGLPATAPARELPITLAAERDPKGRVVLSLAGQPVEPRYLEATALDRMDVRDRAQLAQQRRTARRDLWWWRALVAGGAGLAACLVLELGLAGGRFWLRGEQRLVASRSEAVNQIQATQELATRVGEMAAHQLRPLEMLAVINAQRPASISFLRVVTTGVRALEIEGQAGNPAELRDFETRLKALSEIGRVAVRDPRLRDGQTSFVVEVAFQSVPPQGEGPR